MWSADVFADQAVNLISSSTLDHPFFLYLAFQNIHWPLEAPQHYIDRFAHTTGGDERRQCVCAMIAHLDVSVGKVIKALKDAAIIESTLVVFVSDNGGPTNGYEKTASSNYPLRGGKNTLWEGGARTIGLMFGAGIHLRGDLNFKMHATDWLPTLVHAASGQQWERFISQHEPAYLLGDGLDLWPALSFGQKSPRNWILLETHHPTRNHKSARIHGDGLIVGDWKLLRSAAINPQIQNGWFIPPGLDLKTASFSVTCGTEQPFTVDRNECSYESGWCLFHLASDPCEHNNVAASYPGILKSMVRALEDFSSTAVEPVHPEGCMPIKVSVQLVLGETSTAWQPCDASDYF